MKKILKIISLLLILMMIVMCMVSCGGSDSSDSSDTASNTEDSAASEDNATEDTATEEPAQSEESQTSDEDLIRADLEVKIGDMDTIGDQIVAGLAADEEMADIFEKAGITAEDYGRPLADKIKIAIGDITVSDDASTATAVVTMDLPDFKALSENMDAALEDATEEISGMTQEEIYKKLGEIMVQEVSNPDLPVASTDYTFNYTKTGDTWAMDDAEASIEEFRSMLI